MAWDDAARTMAVNVIAKVEGGGAWDAINYNDPITIGLMQWYATRAAGLLRKIKSDHPDEYAKIASSLRAHVDGQSPDSSFWKVRYLNVNEGNSLKPVLRACKDTQGQLVADDVDDYKQACDRIGLDVDTNTNTAIFFMVMYHQTPARAIGIMKVAGMSSSLDRVYALCRNNIVFGKYRTRYESAYNIIKSGVAPTIIDLNDENTEQDDAGPGGEDTGSDTNPPPPQSDFDKVRTGVKSIRYVGDQLVLYLADGTKMFAPPVTPNTFMLSAKYDGVDVPDAEPDAPGESDTTPDPNPDPPSGDADTDIQNRLVKFMTDRIGRYGYSQGPGRMKPDQTGVADCSSLVRYAYMSITGKDVGTYTDAQVTNKNTRIIAKGGGGNAPSLSILKKGDLIITARHGTRAGRIASHVEMYMGDGKIIGHGGVPFMGPVTKPMKQNVTNKRTWWVKRLNSL